MSFIVDPQDKREAIKRLQKRLFFETNEALLAKLVDRNDIEESDELNLGDVDEK